MQQEARNTETHTRSWSHNNLRHKAVHFVSAGQLQRDEPDHTNGQGEGPTETSPGLETQKIGDVPEAIDDPCGAFFLDSTPQDVSDTGLPDPVLRADPTDSDESSEDEVVFTGRKNNMKPVVIETGKDELEEALESTNTQRYRSPVNPQERATHRNDRFETSPAPATPAMRQGDKWPPTDEVDTLADYIANIDHVYYEDTVSHLHADVQGGMSVGQASAMEEPPAPVSEDDPTHPQEIPPGGHAIHTVNTNEAQVQSSIDVLSRMYLDTEPDASSGLEDDNADMDFTEELSSTAEDERDADNIDLLEEMAVQYSTRKKKSTPAGKQSFLSASAFADALESDPYYGFDIMDFDRPSLRNRTKGTKPPALDALILSDSDLDFHMQEAWQNDRKKKKTKKKEREELRSQGLLGRNPDDADLKAKYAKGMNMEDLVTELRTFLLSPKTSLSLPPMTKHRRKAVHELANTLNLKSQSRGNGPTRFPILIRTSRTPKYTRKTISQVDALLSGRKLNRRLFQSWGSDAPKASKTKRGASAAGVSYVDGDVVGASAPEIGTENRGRAMLEKMGWSTGTALGASNNKGILQPVAHVVKNSRAGLG